MDHDEFGLTRISRCVHGANRADAMLADENRCAGR
jgi:hypothetical protein